MSDDYLSRDRQYLARLQRQRRARMVRIDYMPGADALAIIEAMRGRFPAQYAQARKSSDADRSECARVNDSDRIKPTQRVPCGAKRHRDGQPCQAKSEPGKRRCRFHGGRSTGPRTPEGRARALANLRQYRKS